MIRAVYPKWRKTRTEEPTKTEITLDEDGGQMMLALKDGDDSFRQALSAVDAGGILCTVREPRAEVVCCEGDLVVVYDAYGGTLNFQWHAEGRDCTVKLGPAGVAVFINALKHYCALLMRTNKGM